MYFDLTDEQKMLKESVDGFLADHSTDAIIAAYAEAATPDTAKPWNAIVEMGLPAIIVPEEFGGMGMDLLTLAVVMESFGYYAYSAPLLPHSLVALAISLGGSEEQKQRWLPKLASGEVVGTFAVAEQTADGRWEPDAWTLAGKESGGKLTGSKTHVVAADQAGLLLVGLAGGKLALVEQGAAGLACTALDGLDATRRTFAVNFADTPYELLPGDVAGKVRDAALVCLAADANGAAQRALDMAVDYAKTRKQFDKLIGSFQGLKYQIVDVATQQEPCRYLMWYAAHAFDAIPHDAERFAALAKAHVTDVAVKVARMAVEAHGGIGFTWEYPLHYFLKRAMFDRSYLGLPGLHRERAAQLAGY
jgi:alkylation response protein AidB-like acyl-CoA dehydrogenase